jgi:hypothetical protein
MNIELMNWPETAQLVVESHSFLVLLSLGKVSSRTQEYGSCKSHNKTRVTVMLL